MYFTNACILSCTMLFYYMLNEGNVYFGSHDFRSVKQTALLGNKLVKFDLSLIGVLWSTILWIRFVGRPKHMFAELLFPRLIDIINSKQNYFSDK